MRSGSLSDARWESVLGPESHGTSRCDRSGKDGVRQRRVRPGRRVGVGVVVVLVEHKWWPDEVRSDSRRVQEFCEDLR